MAETSTARRPCAMCLAPPLTRNHCSLEPPQTCIRVRVIRRLGELDIVVNDSVRLSLGESVNAGIIHLSSPI